jgi:hypothetical protein
MRLLTVVFVFLVALNGFARVAAADQAAASVMVKAQFSSRTSLRVSAQLLRFNVADPSEPARAVVEFSAGARTTAGTEVVLSVEAERAVDGPGGAADVETSVSISGEGPGTTGEVRMQGSTVAGRWNGSGLRSGRLVFSLRAGARGTYSLPLRFVLSAP